MGPTRRHASSIPLSASTVNGREPTLVFLHGLGGTRRYWTATSTPIPANGHETVLIDLLGFGDSPKPWFIYTVERHVEALHIALAELDARLKAWDDAIGLLRLAIIDGSAHDFLTAPEA